MFSSVWSGRIAQTLEAGTRNQSAVILIHAGLGSRSAALAATAAVAADFADYQGMKAWISSPEVVKRATAPDWPTKDTADLWRDFVRSLANETTQRWGKSVKQYPVKWHNGELVRIDRSGTGNFEVRTPDFGTLGEIQAVTRHRAGGVLFGRVLDSATHLEIRYAGPGKLN